MRLGDMGGYALLEESLEIAIREGFDDHVGRAYANLIWTTLDYRQYDDEERYIEEGLKYSVSQELAGAIYYIRGERARLVVERVDWKQAESDARWVLAQPEEPEVTTMPALVTLAHLHVRRGDPEVEETLEEAWSLAEPTGELQRIAPVAAARAELAWQRDDLQGIEAAITGAYEIGLAMQQPWITAQLTFWMWRAVGTTELPSGPSTPYSDQMSGDWRAAATAWERIGCPYEQSVALMDSDDADDLLKALAILDELQAAPTASVLRRRLRQMGIKGMPRGPRKETRANSAGLTPRQVDVLELVVQGLTNTEIGDRLFVSPKTVDHHVSALLMKLNVSSRREAAVVARETGLV